MHKAKESRKFYATVFLTQQVIQMLTRHPTTRSRSNSNVDQASNSKIKSTSAIRMCKMSTNQLCFQKRILFFIIVMKLNSQSCKIYFLKIYLQHFRDHNSFTTLYCLAEFFTITDSKLKTFCLRNDASCISHYKLVKYY